MMSSKTPFGAKVGMDKDTTPTTNDPAVEPSVTTATPVVCFGSTVEAALLLGRRNVDWREADYDDEQVTCGPMTGIGKLKLAHDLSHLDRRLVPGYEFDWLFIDREGKLVEFQMQEEFTDGHYRPSASNIRLSIAGFVLGLAADYAPLTNVAEEKDTTNSVTSIPNDKKRPREGESNGDAHTHSESKRTCPAESEIV